MVLQFFKVKLMEGLAGICSANWFSEFSFLPQYFTKAMLLGALQAKFPSFIVVENWVVIKSFSEIIFNNFDKDTYFRKTKTFCLLYLY